MIVALRLDVTDGGTNANDTVGFTVLSSKTSQVYYSNDWVYDPIAVAWRTQQDKVTPAGASGTGVVIATS